MLKHRQVNQTIPVTTKALSTNLTGWFAVALSTDILVLQSKIIRFGSEYITLTRHYDHRLTNCRKYPLREQNGIIYLWRHPQLKSPHWYIPVLEDCGWSAYVYHQLQTHSHPQEIYENSIDMAHFSIVHGFQRLTYPKEPFFDNYCMIVSHAIKRRGRFLLSRQNSTEALFELRLYGLSCAHAHITIPSYGIRVRMLTLATPSADKLVTLRLAIAVHINKKDFVKQIMRPYIQRSIYKKIIHDFQQDIPIWEYKRFLAKPLLVKGDGPILKFRRWCQQFYA